MDTLLSARGLDSFVTLLRAYARSGATFRNFIDGGAGLGSTARLMRPFLHENGRIYAFEPFSGNWPLFKRKEHPSIILVKAALSDRSGKKHFHVASVVTADSEWGRRGAAGYSSLGYLVEKPLSAHDALVPCVRADEIIPAGAPVDFVKLDLQGGELNAIKGMDSLLPDVKFMWVEYIGQTGLIDYLHDLDFVVFDTEYMFLNKKTSDLMEQFRTTKDGVVLSTGARAWFGARTRPWRNFEQEFKDHQRKSGLSHTDLVCVNKRHLDIFMRSCVHL